MRGHHEKNLDCRPQAAKIDDANWLPIAKRRQNQEKGTIGEDRRVLGRLPANRRAEGLPIRLAMR